ncbi:MAG: carboxylate-amine ligase [Anaerolineaceae bacterium]|nr:carboxylate-amine ligase [Anaerolineaceae bacterium]
MIDVPLTLGIEEEFLIVDRETRELSSSVEPLLAKGKDLLGDQIKAELLKSQIEVGSNICADANEIRAEIIRLRRIVQGLAHEHNCEIIAASTHPFSHWQQQQVMEGPRYEDMVANMQEVTRRLLICGMHVHVGFGNSPEHYELIMDIQNQLRYFLPHLLAYSVSSPFWQGRPTGLHSYRSIVYSALPRSGIPPTFPSFADYVHMVQVLGDVGTLKRGDRDGIKDDTISGIDSTRIWWDARPHLKFGTLEIRVCDICTRVEDAVTLVAAIQALVATLIQLRELNMSWRIYPDLLVNENKWRSARHGVNGKLVDYGKRKEVPLKDLTLELVDLMDDAAHALGTRDQIQRLKSIVAEGSSADRQLAVYQAALADGASEQDALVSVVDHLIQETGEGWRVG